MKKDRIITIAVFGIVGVKLETTNVHRYKELYVVDTICYETDEDIAQILVTQEPNILYSIGDINKFPNLNSLPKLYNDRWTHHSTMEFKNHLNPADELVEQYIKDSSQLYKKDLISVFTATYNIKSNIHQAYNSLKEQTYNNWEWVIFDDSTDNETWDVLKSIANEDVRVRLYRRYRRNDISSIGHNKYVAASNCRGEFILELDDDDILRSNCLEDYIFAFNEFPDAGFAYSDWVEKYEDGDYVDYGEPWAMGYGKSYIEGKIKVMGAPNVNPLSIRKLWSSLNHPKAWRKNVYMQIGGHNPYYTISDDYDIIIRTFLATKMIHIPKFHYIQMITNVRGKDSGEIAELSGGKRSLDIQRHVRLMQELYDEKIKNRFEELGVEDWTWNKKENKSEINLYLPNDTGYNIEDKKEKTPKYGDEENYVNYISSIGREIKPIKVDRVDKNVKIVMNSMFGNESKVIERMLNSVTPCIDYYVIQCNGNDDTKNKIERWAKETGIPGLIYQVEWKYPGWNRNDTLQRCLKTNHNCDFILRMDADEILEVDEDFDWDMIFRADTWNVPTFSGNVRYSRNWLWSTKLDWYFALDKRHETIHCDNQVPIYDNLPESFRHVLLPGGDTWSEDYKFIKDALELEKQMLDNPDDLYHLYHIGKSYWDSIGMMDGETLPYGEKQNEHYQKRMIWYFKKFLEVSEDVEFNYYSCYLLGKTYQSRGDWDTAMMWYIKAHHYCIDRNEAIWSIIQYYYDTGDHNTSYIWSKIAIENKYPFPNRAYLLQPEFYPDKYFKVYDCHIVNCYYSGRYQEGIDYANKLLDNPFSVDINNVEQNIRLCQEKLDV